MTKISFVWFYMPLFSLIVTLVKSQLQRLHIFMTLVMSYCSHYLYLKKVNYFVLALVNVIQFGKFSWRETTAQHMFLSPRPLCVVGRKMKITDNFERDTRWHLTIKYQFRQLVLSLFLVQNWYLLVLSNWQPYISIRLISDLEF